MAVARGSERGRRAAGSTGNDIRADGAALDREMANEDHLACKDTHYQPRERRADLMGTISLRYTAGGVDVQLASSHRQSGRR